MPRRLNTEYPEGRVADHVAPPPTPRWVKVFGLAFLVLALAFIGLHLSGRGLGPGAHLPVPHERSTP